MTQGPLRRLQGFARDLQQVARTTLWVGVLIGCACLIGAVATGFLLFAAFGALRLLLGPEFAGLILGAALMVIAAGLLVVARQVAGRSRSWIGEVQPPDAGEAAPVVRSSQDDQLAIAAFTAAFVLGRYLSDQDGGKS